MSSPIADPVPTPDLDLPPPLESKAARWVPWITLCVAVATAGLWWIMAYRPVHPGTVVVVERRGCDICICANPCPCDCECECSVASQKSLSGLTGEAAPGGRGAEASHKHQAASRPLGLALGVAGLVLPFGVLAVWRRRRR
jgi:hypothetical protein